MDPMEETYPSLTPYSYVANNPLIYKDPTGAYIEPASQKEWDKQTNSVTQQRDKLQSSIDKLTKKAADKGWSAEKLAGKIGDKQERVNSLNSTISTFKTLEGSSQGYSLKTGAGEVGGTYYDNASGNVVIDFSNTANFVHEVTHAGQFESGNLAFDPNTPQGSYAQDLFDEVSAYKAELAYSGSSVGGALERATTSSAITADFVKRIATTTGALPYVNHGVIPVNINSSKADLLRAYPHAAAALSGLPSSFVLKNLTDIIYKK
ncbi:MAG TPA: hypothetical protein PKD32_08325 [Saprospiraceae bacterium]|nr:hypothetical protein [Saprospiraceae bacterium]